MAAKQPNTDSSTTKAERAKARRRAWNKAQKKRKAGDYTSVSKLEEDDLNENESKHVVEGRKKSKKKKKKKYTKLLSGDK